MNKEPAAPMVAWSKEVVAGGQVYTARVVFAIGRGYDWQITRSTDKIPVERIAGGTAPKRSEAKIAAEAALDEAVRAARRAAMRLE